LKIAFGAELSRKQRAAIAAECFRQFGMFVFEGMKFAYLSDEKAFRHIEFEPSAVALIGEAYKKRLGVIFVSAHFGNFELAARAAAHEGWPVLVVVRPARDVRTTQLMDAMRHRNGMRTVARGEAGRPMLAALRKGECIALLADQNAEEVFVPFFGQPTGTVDGPARLSIHTGAPVVFVTCVREGWLRYRVDTEGIIEPRKNAPLQDETIRIASELNQLLEKAIRKHPEQWLWFHNRWRSSPDVVVPEGLDS